MKKIPETIAAINKYLVGKDNRALRDRIKRVAIDMVSAPNDFEKISLLTIARNTALTEQGKNALGKINIIFLKEFYTQK